MGSPVIIVIDKSNILSVLVAQPFSTELSGSGSILI